MGLLKNLRIAIARKISVAAIVTGVAVLITAIVAIRVVLGIPLHWEVKSAAENTVLQIEHLLEPRDLIIVDGPYDAPIWYYARLHGLSYSRFDQRVPFDRLFVIVSLTNNQTVSSVLKNRGPERSLVDLGTARLLFNFQNLDTYILPHR